MSARNIPVWIVDQGTLKGDHMFQLRADILAAVVTGDSRPPLGLVDVVKKALDERTAATGVEMSEVGWQDMERIARDVATLWKASRRDGA